MNELPRQKLVEIIARYGPALVHEYRRCEGLLRDYCSGYRREVAVLTSALEERVGADLLAANNKLPREVVLAKLATRLHDNLAMEQAAARWAVNSWALALGFISKTELKSLEQADRQPIPIKAPATQANDQSQPAISPLSATLVVSASGDGDYRNIREAMQNVAAGGSLLVRPGLYSEGIVIDKRVEIVGDGRREEIILASASESCIKMQTDQATVRGLTLRQETVRHQGSEGFFAVDILQGRLTLENCDITSDSLSCIAIHNQMADPLIRQCRIHGSADSGIYIFDTATGTVEECDIYDNQNVGVAITEGASPTIKSCSIRDGRNAGIVVWNRGAGVIEDCNIFSNAKANIGVSDEGNATFRHCRVYEGENSGVFVHGKGLATLEDCEIYNHQKAEVAVTLGGNLTMRDCKIHDGGDDGLFIGNEGRAMIEACEISYNADAGVQVESSGRATIRRCRINHNGTVAISVNEGGTVEVEDCDLTDNELASWQTAYGAIVESHGNIL
jgi:parallel beta-helix repeat protein